MNSIYKINLFSIYFVSDFYIDIDLYKHIDNIYDWIYYILS